MSDIRSKSGSPTIPKYFKLVRPKRYFQTDSYQKSDKMVSNGWMIIDSWEEDLCPSVERFRPIMNIEKSLPHQLLRIF
jgi:hypothetical protein